MLTLFQRILTTPVITALTSSLVSFLLLTACGDGLEFRFPDTGEARESGNSNNQEITVSIADNAANLGQSAFSPNPVTVNEGARITWVNNDSVDHTIASETNLFNSGVLNPGEAFSFTFNNSGTFNYFLQENQSIRGQITVQPAGTPISPTPVGTPTNTFGSPAPFVSPAPFTSPAPFVSPAPFISPAPFFSPAPFGSPVTLGTPQGQPTTPGAPAPPNPAGF